MTAICGPVELGGITGTQPGFTSATKMVPVTVWYNTSLTVRAKRPYFQSPRKEYTDAALAFSFKWVSAMLSYVGYPVCFGMIG